MSKKVIGIDIGGTKIAGGILTTQGKLLTKVVVPTLASKGMKKSLGQVEAVIDKLLCSPGIKKKDIKGIGVCAPGPLDPIKGIVYNPPNLPGWKNVQLSAIISKKYRITTKLENDANAAGKGEVLWGCAKGYKNVFYVTVSTGIGTGIIIDGKIFHGKNGMAGEGGHVTINHDIRGIRCGCGRVGCIESLASGPATVKILLKKYGKNSRQVASIKKISGCSGNLTMKDLSAAAAKGNKNAKQAIIDQGNLIGIWLGSMINILDPEIIVIGGGVSSIGKLIFDPIRKSCKEHSINIFAGRTPIKKAKLSADVGIYGAASVVI